MDSVVWGALLGTLLGAPLGTLLGFLLVELVRWGNHE